MGCFDYSCCISGLPIACGEKVRYLLLTEDPYTDSSNIGMNGLWFPRTFPIVAHYNDYGSVEDVEESPIKEAWLEAFQKDLVEKGWGDNSHHDVPTKKTMDFDELLSALREERVRVREIDLETLHKTILSKETEQAIAKIEKETGKPILPTIRGKKLRMRTRIPAGIPTRRRVERILEKNGFGISKDNKHSPTAGYLVNRVGYGHVRVRDRGYGIGGTDKLAAIAAILKPYATVITGGTGGYAHQSELQVYVKPDTKDYHGRPKKGDGVKKSCLVKDAMIREDVWQAMLQLSNPEKIEEVKKGLRSLLGNTSYIGFRDNVAAHIVQDPPFRVGLGCHWRLLSSKIENDKKKSEAALDAVSEFATVCSVLSPLRYMWRPSYYYGQCEEWDKHYQFLCKLCEIAMRNKVKQQQEQEM